MLKGVVEPHAPDLRLAVEEQRKLWVQMEDVFVVVNQVAVEG
jgi:hypothetical protein